MLIARTFGEEGAIPEAEDEAIAKAISELPEMYKALQEVIPILESCVEGEGDEFDEVMIKYPEYHGKAYCYKGGVLKVCRYKNGPIFMIAHVDQSGHLLRQLPVLTDAGELQDYLDEFAREQNLQEAQS
ncbi:MAG: hypothetical protein II917_07930, partial [Synergistaceae bacterium]|nr:hypothetical protein [Synergistaceae bacterium]